MQTFTAMATNNGVSTECIVAERLLVPSPNNALTPETRQRSFDYGHGTETENLLGTNSTSSTLIASKSSCNLDSQKFDSSVNSR